MKITLTGSLGNTSTPLAKILIAAGHDITVISSNKNKSEQIRAFGAIPAIGSIHDVSFLTKAFAGADAVYTMVPPDFSAPDYRKYISTIGENYATAINAARVKKVVNLSSIGAHLEAGTGPIKGLHDVEKILDSQTSATITHLRAGFFFVNFFADIPMIKQMNIIGGNYAESTKLRLVHPTDIAEAAAEELQKESTQNKIRYVVSDSQTATTIAKELGAAINKPDLKWIKFSDEDAFNGMTTAGLPTEIARNYVEMFQAADSGKLWEDFDTTESIPGHRKLKEFAQEFATRYNHSN
ncbi:MAG: NAD(P)H-binding protein [Gemmatimonadaceae bacterium]|nr:NAD(P)H-binding protein [Chitinophagaceae bacterium]